MGIYTQQYLPRMDSFYADGTWVCPPGVVRVFVTAVAGGGGGGGGHSSVGNTYYGGGGGGGECRTRYPINVVPGTSYTITIGAGGAAGASGGSPTSGGDGGSTSFASALSLSGGKGGDSNGFGGAAGGPGGWAGTSGGLEISSEGGRTVLGYGLGGDCRYAGFITAFAGIQGFLLLDW